MESICRVCGYDTNSPTWYKPNDASFDICPCCSVEFGIQDINLDGARDFRMYWLSKGAEWFSPEYKPEKWNVFEQMKQIPKEWF